MYQPFTLRLGTNNIVHYSSGTVTKDQKKLYFNEAGFLLAIAIADGALFEYDTLNDIRQQVIHIDRDEIIPSFKDSVSNQSILRECTKVDGVTDSPMPESAFLAIFKSTSINASHLRNLSIQQGGLLPVPTYLFTTASKGYIVLVSLPCMRIKLIVSFLAATGPTSSIPQRAASHYELNTTSDHPASGPLFNP